MSKATKNSKPTVLITSGGTAEKIDSVRVMTNVSTGKLGWKIALAFACAGWRVHYAHSIYSQCYDPYELDEEGLEIETVSSFASTADLQALLESNVTDKNAVVHCAAVSDYTFNLSKAQKLPSQDALGFIAYMASTIQQTPKLLPMIKQWNPFCTLVGFKLEVGKAVSEFHEIALRQMKNAGTDITVVNDLVLTKSAEEHIAFMFRRNPASSSDIQLIEDGGIQAKGKGAIAREIVRETEDFISRSDRGINYFRDE